MSKEEMSIESLEGDQVIEMDINRLSQSLVTTATGGRAKTKVVFCRNVIT